MKRQGVMRVSHRELQRRLGKAERARDVYMLALAGMAVADGVTTLVVAKADLNTALESVEKIDASVCEQNGDLLVKIRRKAMTVREIPDDAPVEATL
jgi:hypothetical protein